MRIDKFLKVSRLTKRRETAKALCDAGLVTINSKVVKPQAEVKALDELTLILGRRKLIVRVNEIREYASKTQANDMYEIITDEIIRGEE